MGFSSLVFLGTLLLEATAFALAVAAATRVHHITIQHESLTGNTFTCDYKTGLGTSLGAAAAVLLLLGQLAVTVFTKCMCSFRHLKHGMVRYGAVILFVMSWLSFLIAEVFIIVGSARGTYETRTIVSRHRNHCRVIREITFGLSAAFTFFTLVLGLGSYLCLLHAKKKKKDHHPETKEAAPAASALG